MLYVTEGATGSRGGWRVSSSCCCTLHATPPLPSFLSASRTVISRTPPHGQHLPLAFVSQIRRVDVASRTVTTLAGDERSGGAARPGRIDGPQDGIGNESRLYYPQGIAISTDDSTLFVVEDKCKAHCGTHNGAYYPTAAQYPDGWGNRIRMIDVATRNVTTLAGSSAEGCVLTSNPAEPPRSTSVPVCSRGYARAR